MESNEVERGRFGWRDAIVILATLTSVIGLLLNPAVRKFAANPWAWVYTIWTISVVVWAVDRYRRVNRWLQRYGAGLATLIRNHETANEMANERHDTAMQAMIAANEKQLATNRSEWARQLREMIEDAVEYKANLETVQKEAAERAEADAAMDQRLKAIDNRLPPVGVT
jgi:hypothetical protein